MMSTVLDTAPKAASVPVTASALARVAGVRRLEPAELYRPCSAAALSFATTVELTEATGPVGQARALEALEFGVSIPRQGYHVFALGPAGLGKRATVKRLLEERASREPPAPDWCYVHGFADPHKPRALKLPAGAGAGFARDMSRFVDELGVALPAVFQGEDYRARKKLLEDELKSRQEAEFGEVEKQARERNIALIRSPLGLALAPMRDGEVIDPEAFARLPEAEQETYRADLTDLQQRLRTALATLPRFEREHREKVRQLDREMAEFAVTHLLDELRARYSALPAVLEFLQSVQEDVLENADDFLPRPDTDELPTFLRAMRREDRHTHKYRVNVVVDHGGNRGAPVVEEDVPSHPNLRGCVEHRAELGTLVTDFRLIKAGALHRACGGYLLLDARRVLLQPFAWEGLKQALRSRQLRIESPAQALGLVSTISLDPEPIPLEVKVVLTGDRLLYYLLAAYDPEFPELFKVAADFEDTLDRTPEGEGLYAGFLATLARHEGLLPLERAAVARLVEEGARLAGDGERLSTNAEALLDLMREADHLARGAGRGVVTAEDVERTVAAQTRRADRPRERLEDAIRRRMILVDTDGAKSGQVNGLSILQLGRFRFGHPARITARVRLGSGRVVDIEREVQLGGPLHSKGVLILAGFLAGRYLPEQPLSLQASLVFEQSYGGVEGDSASAAELFALLTALADQPVDQGLAVTGSVNQHGQIQAVGGVNEKIEGFFSVCRAQGLTGRQGVLIPAANVKDLMLRHEVVEAATRGEFHLYPIETVDQGLTLLTGLPAGERDAAGAFPEGSLNARVEARLASFAQKARAFRGAPEPESGRDAAPRA
jgi:predicted ATP-dependent protease